jgi:hypothetical protein
MKKVLDKLKNKDYIDINNERGEKKWKKGRRG